MRTTARRLVHGAAVSIIGALAAIVVAASPAEAICKGKGGGEWFGYMYNGHMVAEERHVRGTCDGDNVYNGQLADPYNDGYAARARYRDTNFEQVVVYATSSSWTNYRFYDQTGNSYAKMQIYSSPASRPSWWTPTWGF